VRVRIYITYIHSLLFVCVRLCSHMSISVRYFVQHRVQRHVQCHVQYFARYSAHSLFVMTLYGHIWGTRALFGLYIVNLDIR
jgi:hypothetical protein